MPNLTFYIRQDQMPAAQSLDRLTARCAQL